MKLTDLILRGECEERLLRLTDTGARVEDVLNVAIALYDVYVSGRARGATFCLVEPDGQVREVVPNWR